MSTPTAARSFAAQLLPAVVGALTIPAAAHPCEREWSAPGTGVLNGQVMALAVFDGYQHAAGRFTMAGGEIVYRVVKWDGTSYGDSATNSSDISVFLTGWLEAVVNGC